MIAVLLALALAPWSSPLSFQPLAGWQQGASGPTRSVYSGSLESSAWLAKGVRYRDRATADPPSKTLAHLPANAMIVWAVIYGPAATRQRPIELDLAKAKHFACCDGPVAVVGGDYELTGSGPEHAYSVIVRVYFGSKATRSLLAQAQRALDHLRLPSPR